MDVASDAGVRSPAASDVAVRTTAEAAALSAIRDRVRRILVERGARPAVVFDLELAVSELATNVIRHGESDDIIVDLDLIGDSWVLDVYGAGSLARVDDVGEFPEPDEMTGRGLIVVAAVTDRIELVEVDGDRIVRCWRSA